MDPAAGTLTAAGGPACRVCGGGRTLTGAGSGNGTVLRCANCGFWFRHPPPPAPALPEPGLSRARLESHGEIARHPDVAAFAAWLRSALAPGGELVLSTPDLGHWRAGRGGLPPGDAVGFTALSLTMLLERYGLRVLRRRPRWRPVLRLVARRSA